MLVLFITITIGCWFTSDKVRLLANFVPRWVIILTILAMYSRLYFFLRRAHRSFLSFGDSSSEPHGSSRTIDGAVEMRGAARGLADGANHAAQGRYGSEKTTKRLRMVGFVPLTSSLKAKLTVALDSSADAYVSCRIHAYLATSYNHPNLPSYTRYSSSVRTANN